jgi:hypothetical protein
MRELVAVKPLSDILKANSFKRDLLLFDQVIYPMTEEFLPPRQLYEAKLLRADITEWEWVHEQGLFREESLSSVVLAIGDDRIVALVDRFCNAARTGLRLAVNELEEMFVRLVSLQLRQKENTEAYPIFSNSFPVTQTSLATRSDVMAIVLAALPVPDDLSPWEQIIDYRNDADSVGKFLAIRNWINEVARGALTPVEIEQKLEYLLSEYQRHLDFHKMKTSRSMLEILVVSAAELLEDTVKFKWGKLAKGLFAIKKRRVDLLEAELTGPGSELAYIIKAHETFR